MDPLQAKKEIKNSSGTYYERFSCFILPPRVNSLGFPRTLKEKEPSLLQYALPNLELQIAIMFLLTFALGYLCKKKGIPPLVPQIITGLLFNQYTLPVQIAEKIFTLDSVKTVGTLSTLTYQLFIFQSGVKMEVGMIRTVGGKVLMSSIACAIIPIIVGIATLTILRRPKDWNDHIKGIAEVTTYSMTSFTVIASILNDLKLVNSELGRLGLSTALVSDLISLVLFTSAALTDKAIRYKGSDANKMLVVIFCFIFFVVFMLRPALKLLVGKPDEGRPSKDLHVYAVISLGMGSVFLANYFELFILFGPFIIGLAVPAGSSLGTSIVNLFDVVQGYFLPLFITVCAMRTNYKDLLVLPKRDSILTASALISLTKFLVAFLSQTYFWKMPTNDAIASSLLMCAKGVVELAVYSFFNDFQVVSDERYAHMVVTVLFLGGIVPVLVKYLYSPTKRLEGHQKRNLMTADPNSDLRIISCIHAPGDVRAVLKLLDASCKGNSPLAIDVLHHIKLIAQSTPVLIAHPKERVVILCDYFYSVNVIRLLNEFEQHNQGCVMVNAFTAVSPPSLMYDDICTLALDKRTSLIILPFHVRWNHHEAIGSESEDKTMRDLNISVLERAPCSIGILVDRYRNLASKEDPSLSIYTVAMVFLGGADDREALVFAMNMAKNSKVNLTVVQLTATKGGENDYAKPSNIIDQDSMELKRDNVVLKNAKERAYVTFKSEVVNNAAATASIIRSMVNEFQLIIVGRRYSIEKTAQTAGLEQWCEYPELGILGDLILAKDSKGTCSLLVVQQD